MHSAHSNGQPTSFISQSGPSYYHNPPPPPQFYGNGPGPAPYYNPYMPPMNGHPQMHQPASPRINSPNRGRYPAHSQRGGMPGYQHYPPMPPPHNLHPGANMQSPPISPVNPYTHPHAPKFSPHVTHVPYSPTYHPQPNGGYHPGWAQPPPVPKQLSMLSPAARSPVPVPAQSLQQELLPVQMAAPQQPLAEPLAAPQHLSPEQPTAFQQPTPAPLQHVPEQPPVQLPQPEEPAEPTAPTSSDPAPEPTVASEPVPRTPKIEFLSEQDLEDDDSEVAQPASSGPANETSTSSSEPSGWVIWSRRPEDPLHAPGVIIATKAFPPDDVVHQALELPTPPPSPKVPSVKLAVEPSVHEVQPVEELANASPDELEVPSSSVTESTPASSTPGETPVPGSPATSRTSVSLPVTSPSSGKLIDVPDSTDASNVDVAAPVPPFSEDPPPASGVTAPVPPAQPTEAQQAPAPAPAPAKPAMKKSWASLLQSGDAAASSSKSRLPTSSVVGFSIPATSVGGASAGPSAVSSGFAAVAHRNELLKLIYNGPPPSNIPPKIQPRGLINTGNMCFANAVLQILVYCQPFNRLFSELSKYLAGPVVGSQKEGSKATPLVDAIIKFVREFVPESPVDVKAKGKERDEFYEPEAFIPSYVYDAMKEKKRFASMIGGHQEDAEEFLGFFLDTLEEEVLALSSSLSPNAPKPIEEVDGAAHDDGWYEVGKKNRAMVTRTVKSTDSPITRIFGGKFRSILRAPHQKDSVTVEDWRSLRLDIQRDTVHTIKDALQSISQPQPVQISQPTRPGVVVEATQQALIEVFPPVLVLHLKRFHYDTNVGDVVKISKQVSYGPELDINPDLIAPTKRTAQPVKYQLFGVLYHHGQSASGGHYTLDVLHPNRDLTDRPRAAWIRIDDELVSDIRPDDVFGGLEQNERCAYLLFYRRLGAWGPSRT
ncbi:uncharacterized protein B0H18DRAFT_992984 [Fomitopsis serialis]|uniref:uncharacterized protein n=1 Tax=Fomitopsis serialis TaxID=139415 RepID=UPI002007E321|nr:uncharacterized protein B0H18DRAFT_992984 [Neoantrodia serialis]KAH9930673.1 hypothetical protein B0H18DRAFT_992984 [Neoantrodia serialis]